MGYVHDTKMSLVIPPTQMFGTVAAWAIAAGAVSNSIVYGCDATDEAAVLHIPINPWSNSAVDAAGLPIKGCLLKSIDIYYEIITAACDAVDALIYKSKLPADEAAVVMSSVAFSYDTGHDTAAERDDLDQHKMTLTLDTPVYIETDENFRVQITFDKAGTSTVEVLCAVANFNFRA